MLKHKAFIYIATVLGLAFFVYDKASAATELYYEWGPWGAGPYIGTQTLTKDNSPYIIHTSCRGGGFLRQGSTLTIEPGVIVKFETPQICFGGTSWWTSYGNIEVAGRLIVNGTPEEPVIFTSMRDDVGEDSNNDGNTTSPQQGDWESVQIAPYASAVIKNAVIRYGGSNINGSLSISSLTTTTTLENLEISNSIGYGLYSGIPVSVRNSRFFENGLGSISTISTVDAINSWWGDDSGPRVASNPNGSGESFEGNVLYDPWVGKAPDRRDPVVVIPGILGSEQKNGVWVMDPILHTYDNLLDTFRANGYKDGVDLFPFPYDWRQSNVDTAIELKKRINEVRNICDCGKVDIVAHSMGGLVARQYIQSENYENDVDQLIFMGTPHLGAPKAYLTWEAGEFGYGPKDEFAEFLYSREGKKLGYNNLFSYIHNLPIISIQELLPTYDYLKDKELNTLRIYPNLYPRNAFLENLNQNSSSLFRYNIEIHNFIGDLGDNRTINSIRVIGSKLLPLWEHGFPEDYEDINDDTILDDFGLEVGSGDGTVPLISSGYINKNVQIIKSEHSELVTDVQGLVISRLAKITNPKLVEKSVLANFKILIIKMLCPADFLVISPDGRRIGKNFSTNGEYNEIEGAFYSGFNQENEYITIPNPLDGEYRVQVQGLGTGDYTLSIGFFENKSQSTSNFTAQIRPNVISEVVANLNANSSTKLTVESVDKQPPSIKVLSPEQKEYLHSDVIHVLMAVEDDSSVYSQSIWFNDILIANGVILDLFFEEFGENTLKISAIDLFGNKSEVAIKFKIIATFESFISDIERSYNLGWITNEGVKRSLVNKITATRNGSVKEKLNAILNEVNAQKNKKINEAAHAIIVKNINWLLNQ